MTAHCSSVLTPLSLTGAEAIIGAHALRSGPVGRVGLEVESHLVDFDAPGERPGWDRITSLRPAIEAASGASTVTFEPGGQVELSGPPAAGVGAAVEAMRSDVQRVRLALAERNAGLALVGADPVRAATRVNPRARYVAMEQHFRAVNRAAAGATMMCGTAALQVNLDAGPQDGWAQRVGLAQQLGPTLLALSACSPWLGGRQARCVSARERAWSALGDRPRTGPDPVGEWVRYALAAPVMFAATGDGEPMPVPARVPMADWLTGRVRIADRSPTVADLDVHLSTLFPPVRLRGYLEIRYLDVSPPRWWPAVAAVVTVLLDDPVAADAAREACEPVAQLWAEAARDGLRDRRLATAAGRCTAIAASRAPLGLARAVEDLAELVAGGRCPGDLLSERIGEVGVARAFEELAHA